MSKIVVPQRARVALLVESSRAYGRQALAGVTEYIRQHRNWSVFFKEQNFDDVPDWLATWRGDGIIFRFTNEPTIRLIQGLKVPAVSLNHIPPALKIPSILTDNPGVGRMGFGHLHERGFRHFAFCGYNGADYSDMRRDGFIESVRNTGLTCHVFQDRRGGCGHDLVQCENAGLTDYELLVDWLKALPKPIGLMACNDMRGQQVLDACRAAGIAVPEEIAVVGVDNDETLCGLADPPLSSVVPNAERIGFEAARMLDSLMNGGKKPPHDLIIGPTKVVTRHSTEVLAMEDRKIAAVVRFVREHACQGIDVSHVLQAVPMPRSTLERRYEKVMGRSLKQDILRFRLDHAKQLLVETDWSLENIADKIGFVHTEYLCRIFKKKTGLTPARFRASARAGILAGCFPSKPAPAGKR